MERLTAALAVLLAAIWFWVGWFGRADYDQARGQAAAAATVHPSTLPAYPPAVVLWRPRVIPDVAAAVAVTFSTVPRVATPARHHYATTGKAA